MQSGNTATAFNPSLANSNLANTFQHTVLTHDSIYPTNNLNNPNNLNNNNSNLTPSNLAGQFNLNNSHNVGIYSTTSRLSTPNMRTLAYGNNLSAKY